MKKDDILIRSMRLEEFKKVCKFTDKRKETKEFRTNYKKWGLEKDVYVLTVDNKIVGMVCYHTSRVNDSVNLYYLIVRKRYRGKGYGLKLMNHLFCFSKMYRRYNLKFRCMVNSKANGFFKKNYKYKPINKINDGREYVYEVVMS